MADNADVATWQEIGGLETSCSARDFLSGVDVWVKRPQVVNRRLLGAVIVATVGGGACEGTSVDGRVEENVDHVLVRELLPRAKGVAPRKEVVSTRLDGSRVSVTFDPTTDGVTVVKGCGSYMLQHSCGTPNRITLSIPRDDEEGSADYSTVGGVTRPDGVTTPTSEWLHSVLLPKVVQWAEESGRSQGIPRQQPPLVPLDKYCSLYRELKEKYGPALIKDWPEATDPHKFVYEDISIATYLIVLWEREREKMALTEKQTFIDLGCGNGLLVFLLTSEGHVGKGIDLRRRKIWNYYGNRADLEVCSLTPSDVTVFPEYDWLIGNHSDELTPWIPLMAARSSYHCRYFVLPCCPHDFDSKFKRPDTTRSQYRSYLDYVRHIGETVGFKVQEDTLRIPSSKRVCHVGRERWYSADEEEGMEEKRQSFLQKRCRNFGHRHHERDEETIRNHDVTPPHCSGGDKKGTVVWSDRFVPRSSTEQTRNCAQVDRNLQQFIIQTLASALLKTENWINVTPDPSCRPVALETAPTPSSGSKEPTAAKSVSTPSSGRTEPTAAKSVSTASSGRTEPTAPKSVSTASSGRTEPTAAKSVSTASSGSKEPTAAKSVSTPSSGRTEPTAAKSVSTSSSCRTDPTVAKSVSTASSGRTEPTAAAKSVSTREISAVVIPACCNNYYATQCSPNDDAMEAGKREGKQELGGNVPCEIATLGNDEASFSLPQRRGNPPITPWNLGGRMRLSEAVQLFDNVVLMQLKQECGGLQTLLRNHHQVFRVQGGFVQLRNWADPYERHGPRKPAKQRSASDAIKLVKTKLCWFHQHHPQGCPRPLEACPYAHGCSKLRERPDFSVDANLKTTLLRRQS